MNVQEALVVNENAATELDAMSIDVFCKRHAISRALFYKMAKAGKGPRIIKIGTRSIISAEAATAWRRRMEAKTAGAT
jgi:predicted DNA-binding transcriptional regulator AlpA